MNEPEAYRPVWKNGDVGHAYHGTEVEVHAKVLRENAWRKDMPYVLVKAYDTAAIRQAHQNFVGTAPRT